MHRVLLAVLIAATLPLRALAEEQLVLGNQLLVKNPSTPDKRKVVVKAKEVTSDNSIVGDPKLTGASITITANGGTPTTQTYPMPNGTSAITLKPFWSGDAVKGYKYKDSKGENGPVKTGLIKKTGSGTFQIKAVLIAKIKPIGTVPPNGGTDGCATLFLGAPGDAYSIKFGNDGVVTNKGALQFKVSKPTTQGTCIPTTTTTSTTTTSSTSTTLNGLCSNGVIDAPEACDPPGSSCGPGATCQIDCTCPCDFLDTGDCLFPFPSDYLTIADPTTDTGRRVHFHNAGMPVNIPANGGVPIESSDYNRNDGFSPGASIITRVPNVDLAVTGAPPITDIENSQNASAPIVVVNASTLAHHSIWAEIDSNATSESGRTVIIRPAMNFAEGTRYIVALRNMKDSSNTTLTPNADFLAYRDNTPTGDPVKEARRPHMEDLFTTLASAGVPRNDLYLAWDFTVASRRNISERVLFMRDDAFDRLGSAAPAFVVTGVQNDVNTKIYRIVDGTFDVERYVQYLNDPMDLQQPPARFALGPDGLPLHQATPQRAPFECIIPRAALADAVSTAVPARASIYGHGLLGSHTEVTSGNVQDMANEHNFVFCATKWIGMSEDDVNNAIGILRNISNFPTLTDRLQQSMVDQLFLARLMIHEDGFASDPAFQDALGNSVIDRSVVFYDGNSQGGIFGGTVMAIAQDITRGVLGVPGMNYSLLLTRSTDWALYSLVLYPAYPNERHHPLILALIQMLWDRSDPNGYAHHMTTDPLPNTPQHKVLLHLAFGDHQVANVATEIEARTIGASVHQPALAPGRHTDVNPYSGIPAVPSDPFDGSALVVWDSGALPPPTINKAPLNTPGTDPHSDPRKSPVARTQKSEFLKSGGAVVDVCTGSPCTAPH
jgi:hypothetical protein